MERWAARVLATLAPLVLLAVDPWGWYPFGPIKWAVVTVVGGAGSLAAVLSHHGKVPRALLAALGLFVGSMLLGAAAGADGAYAWVGTPERHLGAVTWALCALLLLAGRTLVARGDVERVLLGLVVAGVGVGAVATLEAVGFHAEVLDLGGRLTGTFGSSAYLGAATAFLLPVAVGVAATGDTPVVRRRLAAAAALLLAVACAGAGTRAAWVGLVAAATVTVLARRQALVSRMGADRGRAAAAIALVLVAGAAVVVLSPVGARVGSLTDADAPGGQGRLDEWRVAARVVADHPLLGVGPEGYRVAFGEHVDADYEVEHGRDQQPDRAHSGPLDVLLAGGALALAGWLALIGIVARAVRRALRDGPPWLAGLAGGLMAHLVTQLLFFPIAELEPVVWLVAGMVLVATDRERPGPTVRSGSDRVRRAVVGVVAGVALVEGASGVVADHRADRAAEALARGDVDGAATAAASAADLRPDVLRFHLLAARAAVADDRGIVVGLAAVDDALAISPGDPIARRTKAQLLLARAAATSVPAHVQAAEEYLRDLLDRDPNNSTLWRLAADVAALLGDQGAAARARDRADELTAPDRR